MIDKEYVSKLLCCGQVRVHLVYPDPEILDKIGFQMAICHGHILFS